MASIYRVVVNEVRTGTAVMPYHIRAIYESLSGVKEFDGPVETIRNDNKIDFQGSVSTGENNTIEKRSLSTTIGKNNMVKSDQSFVFGEDAVIEDIHRCFYHSFDENGSLKYVRSGKTEAGSGYSSFGTQFPFELRDKTVNTLEITCVGIELETDGSDFHGVFRFKALVTKDGGINVEDKRKEREIRPDFVTTNDVDVRLTNSGIEVKDARQNGNPIYWTSYFDISELENS